MKRVCFILNVDPSQLEEYKSRHREVWPEMRAALSDTGWKDYTLFLRADGLLVGYLVTDDFNKAIAEMKALPVNERWQQYMAPLFNGNEADDNMTPLEEVFHLD